MSSFLLFFLITAVSAAAPYSHLFSVFRDHPDLHTQPQHAHVFEGRRLLAHHAAAIEIEDPDTSWTLSYSAKEHRDAHVPLLSAEIARSVVAIACLPSNVTIQLTNGASAARLAAKAHTSGIYVSGACGHAQTPFYRRLTAAARVATATATVVVLDTEDARLQDILEQLSLAFRWAPPKPAPRQQRQRRRRRRLSLGGWFGEVLGEAEDIVNDVAGAFEDVFNGIADAAKSLLKGESVGLNQTLNLVSYNWDPDTRSAKNKSMPFFHAPWAKCVDCYANLEVYVDVGLTFGPLGIPTKFHAEAGGRFDAKLFIEAKNPVPPENNGMKNWHQLAPRVRVMQFQFMLGAVPVVIVIYVELNGAATIDTDLEATFTVGAKARGSARFGVKYADLDFSKIQETEFEFQYYSPSYTLKAKTAKATMHLSPEIVIALWDAIPVVVKPKPFVSASFGAAARKVEPKLTCSDAYALSSGMDVGTGTGAIRVPESVPGPLGGAKLLPGVDFGTQEGVVPEAGFPDCGPLCGGCYEDYVEHKEAYEREAHEHSADKAEAEEKLKEAPPVRLLQNTFSDRNALHWHSYGPDPHSC